MFSFFKSREMIKLCCPCRVFHTNHLKHLMELAGKQELWLVWERGNLKS